MGFEVHGLAPASDGRDGAVTIHQDVDLYATVLGDGETAAHRLRTGRRAWLHVASGAVAINGEALAAGDSAGVNDETSMHPRMSSRRNRDMLASGAGVNLDAEPINMPRNQPDGKRKM